MTDNQQPTLRLFNEQLNAMGLVPVTRDQLGAVLSLGDREKIIRAASQPTNPNARAYLANLLSRAGLMASASANDQAPLPGQTHTGTGSNTERASFHVYGGKAALCFEADETRGGVATIAIDAAASIGEKTYAWDSKVRIQLTRSELPVVAAVLLGVRPACEFKNHGQDNSKGFAMERQAGGKVFVKVFGRDQGVKAVPVEAADCFFVASLFLRQIQQSCPWLDGAALLAMIRATQMVQT